MLQQTQVNTVIPYYNRFLAQYPSIKSLACADDDAVLHLWTGLGYYARARNLHKTAKLIRQDHQEVFPRSVEELTKLPGIGRSTAGAIASISMGIRAPILDGNVKRVLARVHRIQGWPGQTAVLNQFWQAAEHYTPSERVADYTQAMMDLGATVCTRSQPKCQDCPLNSQCQGLQRGDASNFPTPKPKKHLPSKATTMLLIESPDGSLLLEKRPPSGIWGGLWSFREEQPPALCPQTFSRKFDLNINSVETWNPIKHTFSHFHLIITPIHIRISDYPTTIMEGSQQIWYNPQQPQDVGLAAPVKKLLQQFAQLKGTHHD